MADWFGRSPGYMSSICTDMVIHLQTRFQAFLHWDQHRLTKEKLRFYARHIDKVGGGDLVWGYVDGTLQKICRPGENQRLYYSGHKHYHGFKFQGVISPDGIFSSFFGPIIGSRGDWYIFGKSGLEEIVERLFEGDAAGALYIYGDPAWVLIADHQGDNSREHSGNSTRRCQKNAFPLSTDLAISSRRGCETPIILLCE